MKGCLLNGSVLKDLYRRVCIYLFVGGLGHGPGMELRQLGSLLVRFFLVLLQYLEEKRGERGGERGCEEKRRDGKGVRGDECVCVCERERGWEEMCGSVCGMHGFMHHLYFGLVQLAAP